MNDTANVERFDIYKGSGSSVLGGMNNEGGYGGFLNLTTKNPLAKEKLPVPYLDVFFGACLPTDTEVNQRAETT